MCADDAVVLAQLQCELHDAFNALSDEQKQLSEVVAVMNNFNDTFRYLKDCNSIESLKCLNMDGSVESLLGVSIESLTVESATEGFITASKDVWNKFTATVSKIWEWIKNAIVRVVEFFIGAKKKNAEFLTFVASVDPKLFVRAMKNAKQATTAYENIAIAEAFTDDNIISYAAAMQLIDNSKEVYAYTKASFKQDAAYYIDIIKNDPGKISDCITELKDRIQGFEDEIQECRNKFNNYLSKGSEEGKNASDYISIGWDTDAKIKEFFVKWEEAGDELSQSLKTIRESERIFKDLTVSATGALDPNSEYFHNGSVLLDLLCRQYVVQTKVLITEGSNIYTVLSKCREKLRRAIVKEQSRTNN